ncbi:hypothetical protein TrVGV298_009685 [Trichoderma virens]|nr:hypothetical protein TrVGV298_009685 [Trichoderma virens]
MHFSSLGTRLLNFAQSQPDYSQKPIGFSWRSNKIFIASSVGAGLFTDLFLYGLIVPVLPFMLVDHVGMPQDQVQGHVSSLLAAYAGASVLTSPIAGVITDRFRSRRAPFLLGVTFLTAATTLLVLARTIALLIVARALQGVSACFVWSTGMALLFETVGAADLGKYIGAIFGVISIGTLLAPMLGGILYEKGGLAAVFILAFAILATDFICRLVIIEAKDAEQYNKLDYTNSSSGEDRFGVDNDATEDATPVDEATRLLSTPTTNDDEDPYKISPNLPAIFRFIPILPCLAAPRLIAALTIAFVQAILIGSIDATVPLVSEEYYGFSSLRAGLMFLPIGIANLIFGPFLGRCVDKLGPKMVAVEDRK